MCATRLNALRPVGGVAGGGGVTHTAIMLYRFISSGLKEDAKIHFRNNSGRIHPNSVCHVRSAVSGEWPMKAMVAMTGSFGNPDQATGNISYRKHYIDMSPAPPYPVHPKCLRSSFPNSMLRSFSENSKRVVQNLKKSNWMVKGTFRLLGQAHSAEIPMLLTVQLGMSPNR